MSKTTVYYSSDIHGSNRCFRKFLNAAKFYQANTLIMGGDILGKAIVFLEEARPNTFRINDQGHVLELTSTSELEQFEKQAGDKGLYPYRCAPGEQQALRDEGKVESLFANLMKQRLTEWMALADARLKGTGVHCYIMGGNDDPPDVLEALNSSHLVIDPEDQIIQLDEDCEMISSGWSNLTPWHTPRERTEEEMARWISEMMARVKHPETLIMNMHVPPYNSGLDDAPELNENFKVQTSLGQTKFKPVGSTAVRAAIERYQPLLGLHGHVHEAHAIRKIGRTVCINPGSDFSEGILHGALLVINKGKLKGHQMVSG